MNQLPTTSASTGADGGKIQFSQAEVQTLIRQEVCSAAQRNEARLQSLIESIQQLNDGLNYEKSIPKLVARIDRVSKKADAALAYVMKTHKHPPPPVVNNDIISIDSEDETMETMSWNEKSPLEAKTEGINEIMTNPKKLLKSMNRLTEALASTIEDLGKKQPPPVFTSHNSLEFKERIKKDRETSTHNAVLTAAKAEFKQEQPPPVPIPNGSTEKIIKKEPTETVCNEDLQEKQHPPGLTPNSSLECKGLGRIVKKEPEDPQEGEHNNVDLDQFEDPKAKKVKTEYVSPGSTSNCWYTDRDTIQRGLVFPPLPATTFPSSLSMEAASYSFPPKLEVQLALIKNPTSLSVLWKLAEEVPHPPPMDSYTIFLTMEKVKGSGIFPDWKVLGEVKAIELPMCVLVRKHKPGHKVCAAVVGKDIFGRYGPYSAVATAAIPD